jgi:hypothetical protein
MAGTGGGGQEPSDTAQMPLVESYKRRIMGVVSDKRSAADVWQNVHDWYQSDCGRSLFLRAFSHETGITVNPASNADARIGAALPKSGNDGARKIKDDGYYRAHAEMFVIEMDNIVSRVPRECTDSEAGCAFGNVLRFVRHVLLDSVLLFEHWGSYRAGVPGVFGIGKNEFTHLVNLYHGARQTIYGHGSFGLSFSDNHSELAVATIRQAVEIRLRRAFGLIGKTSVHDGSFHPVALSELLEVVAAMNADVRTPIPFHNVVRINSWANLLMHSGVRHYAWTPPRVLEYLRPLLVGGDTTSNGIRTVDSGVRLTRTSFDAIRAAVKANIGSFTPPQTGPRFQADLADTSECDVVLEGDPLAPRA